MTKYLLLLIALVLMAIALIWVVTGDVSKNLQAEMEENASLRRQVVELEEKQKVYSEVFECAEIRRRLGL